VNPRPPSLARTVIRLLTPPSDRAFVLSDLDETFEEVARNRGEEAARRWYRRQAITSVPALLGQAIRDSTGWLSNGEVTQSLRSLRRRPQYALGVAGTLALGFASAIVLGGIAWQVWLQPLPFPDSEKLVRVYELERVNEAGDRTRYPLSPPLLAALRDREFSHLSGFASILGSAPEWIVEGEIRHLDGAMVSPGFFSLLGVRPLQGRGEWSGDDGNEVPEAILSEHFWRQTFGADPEAVGRMIDLAGVRHRIVGVVPQSGEYPEPVDLFTPLNWNETQLGEGFREARYVEAVGRVRPSSSIEAASAEFAAFIEGLGAAWDSHAGWSGELVSLREDIAGPFRPVLRLLLGAGLAFLTLSVVNVLGLAAARQLERSRDAAVRVALGASRARLGRSALLEGAVLGLVGGAAALLGARLLLEASVRWLPEDLPRTAGMGLSLTGGGVWLLAAMILGAAILTLAHIMVPAADLRMSGARVSRGLSGSWLLVVGQFGLTTLLLATGALAVERSVQLADRELGFEADGVWTALVGLPRTTSDGWEPRRDAWDALLTDLQSRGYRAAISTNPPMAGSNNRYDYRRTAEDEQQFGQYAIISPDYFQVMGIPILEGRSFEDGQSAPAVVISRSLAEEVYPGESPVGLTLSILQEDREIIGVVESTSHFGPDTPSPPAMYVSYEAENWNYARILVRGGDQTPEAIASAVQSAVPGAAPPVVIPYRRHLSDWFRPLRIQLGIVGALAVIGGLLAALGLYSAIRYQVRGRLPELGIRKALGAHSSAIMLGVVRRGAVTAAVGLTIGMGLWWLSRGAVGEALGAEAAALSVPAFSATALAVLVLAIAAVAGPARRAAAADPLESLRSE